MKLKNENEFHAMLQVSCLQGMFHASVDFAHCKRDHELELCAAGISWEGDCISNVINASYKANQSLETKAISGMRSRTEAPQVKIPPKHQKLQNYRQPMATSYQ